MLGTSDAWSTSHLSQQPNEPAYCIVDCRILGLSIVVRRLKAAAHQSRKKIRNFPLFSETFFLVSPPCFHSLENSFEFCHKSVTKSLNWKGEFPD